MDRSKLNQLKLNLRQVLNEGKKSGLAPTEIQRCVKSIVGNTEGDIAKPCRGSRKRTIPTCILLLSSLIVVVLLCMYCEPVRVFLKRHMQYLMYLINRRIRLVALPLIQHRVPGTGYYKSDCLVRNPFVHDEIYIDCLSCSDVTAIKSYQHIQSFTETHFNGGTPIKVLDSDIANVNFDDIKARFQSYFGEHVEDVGEVLSHDDQWSNIKQVFANEVTSRELILAGCNVRWKVYDLRTHNLLRNITPVPYFFPMDGHASIERYTLIDSPSSDHVYNLPIFQYENIWLSQVQGTRIIVLHPVGACAGHCQVVQTQISRGETLYFNAMYWKASSYNSNGDDLSIGIAGSVL